MNILKFNIAIAIVTIALSGVTMAYEVGDVGPAGGIVFYTDSDGLHGLEASPTDQRNAEWGCHGINIGNATEKAIGTGYENTKALVQLGCSGKYMHRHIAAMEAGVYYINGFFDWYLPSIDELHLMYTNLKAKGLGNFKDRYYWSSSSHSAANHRNEFALIQDFRFNIIRVMSRDGLYIVRAIRSF